MVRRSTNILNKMNPVKKSLDQRELREKIHKKAYELFTKRGCSHGNDKKDWFEAERVVMSELKKT